MLAKQFHETTEPVSDWLSLTEKKLANSEPIGTQTAKIQQQISRHKVGPGCEQELLVVVVGIGSLSGGWFCHGEGFFGVNKYQRNFPDCFCAEEAAIPNPPAWVNNKRVFAPSASVSGSG